jgi:hypothetical protein
VEPFRPASPITDIPQVPSIYAVAKSEEQRQLLRFVLASAEFGRPYVLPPEVSANRVALKSKIDMTYLPPERLEQLIASLYRTPPDLIETVKRLVPNLQ